MKIYEYYELRGLDKQQSMPSGMFRVVRTKTGLWYERITLEGKWVIDNELVAYLFGHNDNAEKITKKKALVFEKYLKSGKGAKDKAKGKWGGKKIGEKTAKEHLDLCECKGGKGA